MLACLFSYYFLFPYHCCKQCCFLCEFAGYQNSIKKSHICEEGGGAHLRISVWHLLINLKNNYSLKKLLKWANKKCKNFNINNVVFKKKIKKNSWRCNYFTPLHQKSWYDLQFSRYKVWQAFENYGSFSILLTPPP